MAEYIERESAMLLPELPKEYRHYQTDNLDDAYEQGWYNALCCIEHIPAADGAPVVHGRWIKRKHGLRKIFYHCSHCHFGLSKTGDDDYCNCCGAKMDEEG